DRVRRQVVCSVVASEKLLSFGLRFCFSEAPHGAAHKKQMPFLAGQGAWPSALSRARSLRLSERSGRPLTGEAGGPGADFQQEGRRCDSPEFPRWQCIGVGVKTHRCVSLFKKENARMANDLR